MNENTINNDVTIAGQASVLAGRYRILKQLGAGGMGSVWLAEDTQLDGKLFAIKMLPSILVSNKRAYQQLKSEALVAMKLIHPNIVQIRAFEENNGNPFLVMDYIRGETLDDWLGNRGQELGASEEDVIRLLKPIAEALDYAHSKGVVHRDVKPGNIIVAVDGTPYVLDFGIAREIQETMTFMTGKMSSGTLMYMSPEQLHGAPPNKFQDIYSFAAMAYECLRGRPPFCRGQIEYQIDHDEPEALSESIAIAPSVMRGLAKKPDDRPESCVGVLKGGMSGGNGDSESCREPLARCVNDNAQGDGFRISHLAVAILALFAFGGICGGIWHWADLKARVEARRVAEAKKAAEQLAREEAEIRAREASKKIAENTRLAIEAFKAERWEDCFSFSKNADLNDKTIQFCLGVMYESGHGVPKDEREAVKWLRKSAEQENASAQCYLGLMYANGQGVAKDESEAVKWYHKSAEQGNATAKDVLKGLGY